MVEKMMAVAIAAGILLGMFLWAPLLDAMCPACSRIFQRRSRGAGRPSTEADVATGELASR